MKRFLLPILLLTGLAANAQAVRFATSGHLDVESQPSMGYELPAYLGVGDSVQLVSPQPTANPRQVSENMRRNFVYVRYPAYRGQPAGQGWVLRHYLVSTLDSTLLPTAALPAQTYTTTKVVTTRRYVPVTKTTRPHAETGKVTAAPPATSGPARSYHAGPKGGCYYLGAGGKKVYVDRSYCN